jgi:nitrous oxide reductase accessory protein NosL
MMEVLIKELKRSVLSWVLAWILLGISSPLCLAGSEKCIVCGMDVSKYPHTRYSVETMDGKVYPTCGAQCGLTLHLRFGDQWKRALAADLLSNRSFAAADGFYVYKSTVITDMAPGFISFRSRTHAEKFAVGFGGQVTTYEEALEIWRRQMK